MSPRAKRRKCRVCGRPCEGHYCPGHKPSNSRAHAESTTKRGYGWSWQKWRARFLVAYPWCADCEAEGRVKSAEEVHHIKKVRDHPELRTEPSNCMALCKACHAKRSARGE